MRTMSFLILVSLSASNAVAQDSGDYLAFIRAQAAALRAHDKPPASREEWRDRNAKIRAGLLQAWGGFPKEPAPLDSKKLGELKRDGYRVEKIVFQTLPDLWMTANAYVPDRPGKLPAILMVHGHWRGAKQDPVVQARCIGAAKLGFFVLVVDAFGAGERAVGNALGEYHGEMTAATLLPIGTPLSGIQVYENMRAVDYLRSRPEVDGRKIGITGASGGGNQTMYAGSWDERFGCVVPVCSVGNYQAYLGTACCMCEVVPGALRFTEEAGILGLVAPRGLMVVNATRDGIQFSVPEAKKSIAAAEPIFKLFNMPDHLRQTIFDSSHDYSKAMREAMYGWMTMHLKGLGDGSSIPEPALKTEEPEALRCYPGESRPADWMTIPKFAAREARRILADRKEPSDAAEWRQQAKDLRERLENKILGGLPGTAKPLSSVAGENILVHYVESEPGIRLKVSDHGGLNDPTAIAKKPRKYAIMLDLEGEKKARQSPLFAELIKADWTPVTLDLRATGDLAWKRDLVGKAPDHNTAEWGLWIGRPLLGQWTVDVRAVVDLLATKKPSRIVIVGTGPAGIVALTCAAVEPRINAVAAVGSLASFVSDVPYQNQRLGILAPGVLRDVGDVAHLAALIMPRRVVLAGGVRGDGKALSIKQLQDVYQPAIRLAKLLGSAEELKCIDATEARKVVGALEP